MTRASKRSHGIISLEMFEYSPFVFTDYSFHSAIVKADFLCQLFIGRMVYKPPFQYMSMQFIVDVFINYGGNLGIRVFLHATSHKNAPA